MSEVEQDRSLTRQGFTKASFLTDEQIDKVMAALAEGQSAGVAARAGGTSFTQFLRRVRREPDLHERYREAENEGRQKGALSSGHGRGTNKDDAPGAHEGEVPV